MADNFLLLNLEHLTKSIPCENTQATKSKRGTAKILGKELG